MLRVTWRITIWWAIATSVGTEVVDGAFYSSALGVEKRYRVYLPSGYASDDRRYPVIYLLHGWGVTERYWTDKLGLSEAAAELDLKALVVMPDGDRSYYANSDAVVNHQHCMTALATPTPNPAESRAEFCVQRVRYEDYIVRDLMSHIDSRYRTVNDRSGRALSGESAGGFGAMNLALRNPHLSTLLHRHGITHARKRANKESVAHLLGDIKEKEHGAEFDIRNPNQGDFLDDVQSAGIVAPISFLSLMRHLQVEDDNDAIALRDALLARLIVPWSPKALTSWRVGGYWQADSEDENSRRKPGPASGRYLRIELSDIDDGPSVRLEYGLWGRCVREVARVTQLAQLPSHIDHAGAWSSAGRMVGEKQARSLRRVHPLSTPFVLHNHARARPGAVDLCSWTSSSARSGHRLVHGCGSLPHRDALFSTRRASVAAGVSVGGQR